MKHLSIFLLFTIALSTHAQIVNGVKEKHGAWIRNDISKKKIFICFTAHEFIEGLPFVMNTLDAEKIKASFFLTGDFVRSNPDHTKSLYNKGHYVGAHSDKHLLYCDWENRDSLLVSIDLIETDLNNNIEELSRLNIPKRKTKIVMPPYEWYNLEISKAMSSWGFTLVNFTPGTSSNADYTTPDMKNYLSSDTIFQRILNYEATQPNGLNGFHLLIHVGTDPKRTDKFYHKLPVLIKILKEKGYEFERF